MSEANFTKGEWKILDRYQVGVSVNFGDGFFTIASCQVFNEGRANAHLIAAAPEMYALLENVQDLLIEMSAEDNYSVERKGMYGKIEQLLNKARGEA